MAKCGVSSISLSQSLCQTGFTSALLVSNQEPLYSSVSHITSSLLLDPSPRLHLTEQEDSLLSPFLYPVSKTAPINWEVGASSSFLLEPSHLLTAPREAGR